MGFFSTDKVINDQVTVIQYTITFISVHFSPPVSPVPFPPPSSKAPFLTGTLGHEEFESEPPVMYRSNLKTWRLLVVYLGTVDTKTPLTGVLFLPALP